MAALGLSEGENEQSSSLASKTDEYKTPTESGDSTDNEDSRHSIRPENLDENEKDESSTAESEPDQHTITTEYITGCTPAPTLDLATKDNLYHPPRVASGSDKTTYASESAFSNAGHDGYRISNTSQRIEPGFFSDDSSRTPKQHRLQSEGIAEPQSPYTPSISATSTMCNYCLNIFDLLQKDINTVTASAGVAESKTREEYSGQRLLSHAHRVQCPLCGVPADGNKTEKIELSLPHPRNICDHLISSEEGCRACTIFRNVILEKKSRLELETRTTFGVAIASIDRVGVRLCLTIGRVSTELAVLK